MPRRKSLLAQMYEARQKAKLQQKKLEDQASRAWAAEERKVSGPGGEGGRAAAAGSRTRSPGQAEGGAAGRARPAAGAGRRTAGGGRGTRAAAAGGRRTREQQRQEAERRRRAAERRAAEAEFRTEAVQAKVAAFERLLPTATASWPRAAAGPRTPSTRDGPEAFVEAVQRALATSVYPDGLDGSCAAQYVPESASCGWSTSCPARTSSPRSPATGT